MIYSKYSNELELVRKIQNGDSTAMQTLYCDHVEFLTAVCARYISTDEDLHDVLQDSFIKILTSIDKFEYRDEGSLRAWMTRIVVNESLKFLKQKLRIEFVEYDQNIPESVDDEPETENIPPSVIQEMIRKLPDGYRTVFNLYVFENKSHKEIASLLNIKEKTSSSQFHRAKNMLAKLIKEYELKEQ